MKNKSIKILIMSCIFTLMLTLFPSFKASASTTDTANFDLNSVDSQSAEVITELKESENVLYYEENSESITFYIQEPLDVNIDNGNASKDTSNIFAVASYGVPGVTKVVWHSGFMNFDLYLSASAKTTISKMSAGGTAAYLAYFLPGGIIVQVAAGALGSLLPTATYSYGSVYVFRNGSYRYNYMQ